MTETVVFSKEVQNLMSKVQINDLKSIPLLTRREKEILKLLTEGKSTQEISYELISKFFNNPNSEEKPLEQVSS